MEDLLPEPPSYPPRSSDSAQRKTDNVESAARDLARAVTEQFTLCSQVSAIDVGTLAAMNKSVEAFHAALQERVGTLLSSAHSAQRHADASRPLAHQMTTLLQKARHLEAIIDRLDEYTSKQETSLTHRYNSTSRTYVHHQLHIRNHSQSHSQSNRQSSSGGSAIATATSNRAADGGDSSGGVDDDSGDHTSAIVSAFKELRS